MKKNSSDNMGFTMIPPPSDGQVIWNDMGTVIMNSTTFLALLTGELSKDRLMVKRLKKALVKHEH